MAFLIPVSCMGTLVVLAGLQRSFIYLPYRGKVPLESSRLPADRIRDILVPGTDGLTLHGWLTTPGGSADSASRFLVILFPGNAGHRGYRAPILAGFNELNCDALTCDYRGYAENAGRPSEEGLARDARAIWDYACGDLKYSADRIVLCGQSLGGGVATRLAWELCREGTPPAGLILRATFTSLTDAAKNLYPWLPVRTFLVDRYPSLDRIGAVTCPLLVMHGERDEVVPFEQGERLFAAAPEKSASGVAKSFLALPHSGHNDILMTAADVVHEAHRQFLQQVRAARSPLPVESP